MADPKLVEILKQGSEVWNRWRNEQLSDCLQVDLINADLSKTNLPEADLSHADLVDADLSDADLREANLSGAYMRGVNLSHSDLSHATLRHANMCIANLNETDLIETNLSHINLNYADLRRANLSKADLSRAALVDADLSEASLNEANLSDANLYKADLSEADLYKADLSHVNLNSATLSGAYLSGATLYKADLSHVNLNNANLSRASFSDVDLNGADLSGADLSHAYLSGTNLSGARLFNANLSGAIIDSTIFAHVDLRTVKGLAEIRHQGPSDISLYTTLLPQDDSVLHFLRGAGLSDEWIAFYQSTMMHPIQYHSCFISYAHQDDTFARLLYAYLQDKGVRCWFAEEDLKIGDHYHQRIDEAIRLYDKLILVLSDAAVQSAWVEREVVAAREKEDRQQREVLFPLRLDDAVMQTNKAWAADVRRRWHIGDFTCWKDHDSYQRAFERLLRDLKAETKRDKHG